MKNILKKNYIFNFAVFTLCIFTSLISANDADFNELLTRYHLDAPTPVTYQYKTEIAYSYYEDTEDGICEESGSFELPESVENLAIKKYKYLNDSDFFNTRFIRNPKEVKTHYLNPKSPAHQQGKIVQVTTEDSIKLNCTFFDRGEDSKKLLIIGGGFTNEREIMIPFVEMFADDYDIVIMEYRGHGLKDFKLLHPSTWINGPTKTIFGANLSDVKLGAAEEKDVFAVVNEFKNKKNYEKVAGLGVCYSALIFIKSEAVWQQRTGEKLFNDGIIADGCWLSLQNFIEKIAKDPKLILAPQRGGWEDKWLVRQPWFEGSLIWFAQKLFHTKFNEVSILDYLPHIKTIPILYFYGKNDLVIYKSEFEIIWNATKTQKAAIITSNPHVINHIKQKELYKKCVEDFLNLPFKSFISSLQDTSAV